MRMETALIHRDTSDNHHFSIQNANNASPAFYLKAENAVRSLHCFTDQRV